MITRQYDNDNAKQRNDDNEITKTRKSDGENSTIRLAKSSQCWYLVCTPYRWRKFYQPQVLVSISSFQADHYRNQVFPFIADSLGELDTDSPIACFQSVVSLLVSLEILLIVQVSIETLLVFRYLCYPPMRPTAINLEMSCFEN